MGRRGPPPTPTAVLAARGSWRAKLNPNEMKPKSGSPKPPKDLKPEALAEWKRVVKELAPTGVLTIADRPAMIAYVQSWALMQEAYAEIVRDGSTIKQPNGWTGPHPALSSYKARRKECDAFWNQFGQTPSARARIPSGESGKEESEEDLVF